MKEEDIKLSDLPLHFYMQLIGDLQNGILTMFKHLEHVEGGDLIQKIIDAECADAIAMAQALNFQGSKEGYETMEADEITETAVDYWLREFHSFMKIAHDMEEPERTEFTEKFGMRIKGDTHGA
ncbi:MAG: hypothetical protein GOVbin2066_26 [Prokaryotic dsDNA virus sp.]|nr:MAG: hypothetical protein GOVbin2066_26 [Prokaryotic dsDNA virus sp.]|tara:strand:+ start:296 stop:667 length:372 start_codon:yes stop_codon:yes gene_type:complete